MTYASAHHTKCDLYARATRSKSFFNSDSDGNRTRVTAVKGRCLNRLTTEPWVLNYKKTTLYKCLAKVLSLRLLH